MLTWQCVRAVVVGCGSMAVQFRVQPLVFPLDHVMDSFLEDEGGGKVPERLRHDRRKAFDDDSLGLVKMETTVRKAFVSGDAAWIDGNAKFHGETEDTAVETVHVSRAGARALREGDNIHVLFYQALEKFRVLLQCGFRRIKIARQTCVEAEEREFHRPAIDDLDGFDTEESHEKSIRACAVVANVNACRRVRSSFVSIIDLDERPQAEMDNGTAEVQNHVRTHAMFPQILWQEQDA